MKVLKKDNNIILTNVHDFNLKHIFECGQAFRWDKNEDNSYTGVAFSKALTIRQDGDCVTLFDTSVEDFENIWYNYFDFETDYSKIKNELSCDEVLKKAIPFGEGIRILKQDFWECLVSFIISQSNNIPRIKKIIAKMCELYGNKISYMGKTYYDFPSCEKINSLSISQISETKCGFRDKYIWDASEFILNHTDIKRLKTMSYDDAKKELLKIKGVGNKVADCVLLFGLSKCSSFPVDVWVKRIVEYLYFDSEKSIAEINEFSKNKFKDLGGYAQQYLFYYARENKIGV